MTFISEQATQLTAHKPRSPSYNEDNIEKCTYKQKNHAESTSYQLYKNMNECPKCINT